MLQRGGRLLQVWPTRSVLFDSSVCCEELLKPEKVFPIAGSDSRGSLPPKGGWESIDSSHFLLSSKKILSGASVGVLGAYPYCVRQLKVRQLK